MVRFVAAVYPEDEPFSVSDSMKEWGISILIAACPMILCIVWRFTRSPPGNIDVLVNQLQSANKRLEKKLSDTARKLQIRSTFFQEASHDLHQHLHAMQLLVHVARGTPEEATRALSKLSNMTEDLQVYVKRFLELEKLEATLITLRYDRIHLQDVFQSLELVFEGIAQNKNIALHIRATKIHLSSDAALLSRILENLLSNAIKFAHTKVLIAARKKTDGISIEVWNNGDGIPISEREIIFDKFHQYPPLSDPKRGGVGLGLSIVRRYADILNYRISIVSHDGKGCVVKIFLPTEKQ